MHNQRNSIVSSQLFRYISLLMLIIGVALWVPYATHASPLTGGSSAATPKREAHLDVALDATTRAADSESSVNSTCPYVPSGSYQQTCRNIHVTLSAECQKIDGSWQPTTLDLTYLSNADVENANGTLRVAGPSSVPLQSYLPYGSYQQTCRNIHVTLSAECQKIDGSWQPTTLDLTYLSNADVLNSDGILKQPIAAAWMYMADDRSYATIPQAWTTIDFKKVDMLYVGPAGVQSDGTFGFYNSTTTGDLATRFKWIMHTARSQNPNIKIIVSQWWGNGTGVWGNPLNTLNTDAAIRKYTESVNTFLQSYLLVSGGVDGYDIDYEDNNVVSNIWTITSQIRTELDALRRENGGRPFYLTVSPATITNLSTAVPSLHYVNMQTYAGGKSLTPQQFTLLGLKPQQLLYGYCPETRCSTPTIDEVKAQHKDNQLAGIHLWRLNSDNYQYEIEEQAKIYSFLHPQ
jgi:hypothetical protein